MSTKVLIAAGGTGGHIYPAIALGEALRAGDTPVEVDFACGERELELKLFRDAGEQPIVFPARQLGSGLVGKLRGVAAAAGNVFAARKLIRERSYHVVVGMGGYVSGPTVLGAVLARRPTVIHEANSIPGKTNRILAPMVSLTALHFAATARHLRARRTAVVGMPLRGSVGNAAREQGIEQFGLAADKRSLIILGGSQGARFLYATLLDSLPLLDTEQHADVQILWSTGAANFDELNARLQSLQLRHITVQMLPFISRVDLALAAADVAVARAGASTMAELLACGIQALYIPFPAAIYNHQTLNAREAADAGLGKLLQEKDLTAAKAAEEIALLLAGIRPGHRLELPEEMNSRHAARRLAEQVLALIR